MPISNIADFVKGLQNISKKRGYELFFRGHDDINYKLLPSIYRNKRWLGNERNLFKEFILRTPSDFLNEKSALEKLVKMQHYGLPTRLLDLTTNPLVALYFACEGKGNRDGEVIIFQIPKQDIKYYDSNIVSILSNIAKRPNTFNIEKIRKLSKSQFNGQDEIQHLIHEIKEEKSYFLPNISPKDVERVVAVKVKQSNARIIKQSGTFLIFGINGRKTKAADIPENWVLNPRTGGVNFKIDKNSKENILDELNVVGINEATLFPELDNQAKYLKRLYS